VTSFFAALEFLTRLRLRRVPAGDAGTIASGMPWFPAVGLVIGLVLLAVDRVTMRALPPMTVDSLIVVAWIAVTGALHLDGLADSADGLWGGRDRVQRLTIMHDVRTGTYGVVAIIAVLVLKWSGLAALPGDVRVEAIVLVPCLARFGMLVAIAAFPYARTTGAGATLHARAWPAPVLIALATASAASIPLLGVGSLAVVPFAAGAALAIGIYSRALVGGMTGDLYGATVEVSEALLLLYIAALANRHWLDGWLG
jgi:adenosylcobinamide-GDP ribazoletransferase